MGEYLFSFRLRFLPRLLVGSGGVKNTWCRKRDGCEPQPLRPPWNSVAGQPSEFTEEKS